VESWVDEVDGWNVLVLGKGRGGEVFGDFVREKETV